MRMLNLTECWQIEKESRESIDPNRICSFGISALDDPLIGILRNDLVVIGADSGSGKSQICLDMAMHNARNGKKVALYFIEGGAIEATARIKWKSMCEIYYKNKEKYGLIDLDYRKWRMNKINNIALKEIERIAIEEFEKTIKNNLQIYHFNKGFKISDLTDSLAYFLEPQEGYEDDPFSHKYNIDLIIIDHLQYFNLASIKSEFQEMTDILMAVKDITNFNNIPVVLVSHLRKKEKDRGLPDQEDLYGTSNIAKIASMAIVISPYHSMDNHAEFKYPTFFRVVKSRTGIRSSLGMLCNYDFKNGCYEKKYEVYQLKGNDPLPSPLQFDKLPKWAKINLREILV